MCARARRFCLTLNNYTEKEYFEISRHMDTKQFWIIGKEVGSENNTPHLQIYFESKNPIKISTLKRFNNRWHIEIAKGSRRANYEYCSKEGDFTTNIKEEDLEKKEKNKFNEVMFGKHYVEHREFFIEERVELIKFFTDNFDHWIMNNTDTNIILTKIKNMLSFLNEIIECEFCDQKDYKHLIDELVKIREKHFSVL